MAQSKRFFDDVKNQLECSVCQEQFSDIKEPKILKCLHTFCKTCLEAWLRQQREGTLSCPTCRQITECSNNNIDTLPSNLFCKQLVEIVEAYSGQGQDDSQHCGNCDERKSLKCYCSDCNSLLCDDCIVVHKKGKIFRGHHVKEIGNFESSDMQDYARRANICKKHKDEVRFYCEKCQICICRDCAILEHQDHNKISLDQGIEDNKSEIETKMRAVQENGCRLRNYRDSLEKRKLKLNGNIEEATKEVKRVAQCCMSLIHQHEASVTERLVVQKATFQDAFDTQMSSLDGKLMEIDSTLAFSEDVFLRRNLPEILNVKAMIEQRLQELAEPFDFMPQLDCSGLKYVQNDVSFLKDAPGKLVMTNTEPSLSVAEGKSLTKGFVQEDCTFTVTTKNSAGQKTYSEIDEISVKITPLSKHKDIQTVTTDLKDGRYSISYRPTTPGEFTVSIDVTGNPIMETPFKLNVTTRSEDQVQVERTNQCKSTENIPDSSMKQVVQHKQEFERGVLTVEPFLDTIVGENDQPIEVFKMVSAELSLEVVENLSREQTKALLEDIKDKTGVQWFESAEKLMMSGTFQQMEESRTYLQQSVNQSNGIVVSNDSKNKEVASQKRENDESPFHDEAENQADVNQNNPRERTNDETGTDRKASSTAIAIESFEIQPKIARVLVKAHGKELEDIETKYDVEIPRKAERSKLCIKPKDECSADDYEEACNQFITLYQKAYLLIRMERFSLKSEAKVIKARQVIYRMGKQFPILVEKSKDQNHWELYGEASHIEEALEYLKQQGVEIKREKENPAAKNGRRKKPEDNEDAMDVDPPEYSKGGKNPGTRLETYLLGKVKVSVYKGDITNERVDVIVNAANKDLDHIGGVAKAILDKGGKPIKKESLEIIKKRKELKDGDAVATSSGRLPCKVVVHAVGPKWSDVGSTNSRKLLLRACLNSLCETEKRNMTSIALPAIVSGIYGMPKDVCAEVMFDAVEEFVRQGDAKKKTITDIRFVNIDDPSVQAFSKEFNSRYGNDRESSSSKNASRGGTANMSPTGAEGGGHTLQASRSNRGSGQNKNVPDSRPTTNPNNAGDYQHHPTNFDYPLSSSSHFSSSNASYSSAVKINAGDHDKRPLMPQSHEGKTGFSLPQKGGDGVKADKKEDENCPICLDTMTNPRTLSCKHVFCSGCLQTALDVCNKCPVCQQPQGVLTGNQPRGEMTLRYDRYSVPGYEGYGTIVIDYQFPSGVQGREHPHPGQYYNGTSHTGYLPDTSEGREVLQLLRRAFDARLVFTVGTSYTTGLSNQVICDIHHKTSVSGGPFRFGYPDPDYLRRVKEELAAKGIR